MYRFKYDEKEMIIRFTSFSKNKHVNKDYLYRKIVSISDNIMDANHGTSFIVEDDIGRLVVCTVQHGEISVISIHHIIDQAQIYTERREAKKPS
ncbi:hypothetical protein [Bacillus nitroreducens]